MSEMLLCKDCLVHIPDYLTGAMHLGLRIPKELFTRKGFLYPPFQMCIERPAKTEKPPWLAKK